MVTDCGLLGDEMPMADLLTWTLAARRTRHRTMRRLGKDFSEEPTIMRFDHLAETVLNDYPSSIETYFNRPDNQVPLVRLVDDILSARYFLYVAAAWFTHRDIARAIVDSPADLKGVIVNRADLGRAQGSGKRLLQMLRGAADVSVLGSEDFTEGIMHHKFIVADVVVWCGSYNLTYQAAKNYEALVRIEDPFVARMFMSEARALLARGREHRESHGDKGNV